MDRPPPTPFEFDFLQEEPLLPPPTPLEFLPQEEPVLPPPPPSSSGPYPPAPQEYVPLPLPSSPPLTPLEQYIPALPPFTPSFPEEVEEASLEALEKGGKGLDEAAEGLLLDLPGDFLLPPLPSSPSVPSTSSSAPSFPPYQPPSFSPYQPNPSYQPDPSSTSYKMIGLPPRGIPTKAASSFLGELPSGPVLDSVPKDLVLGAIRGWWDVYKARKGTEPRRWVGKATTAAQQRYLQETLKGDISKGLGGVENMVIARIHEGFAQLAEYTYYLLDDIPFPTIFQRLVFAYQTILRIQERISALLPSTPFFNGNAYFFKVRTRTEFKFIVRTLRDMLKNFLQMKFFYVFFTTQKYLEILARSIPVDFRTFEGLQLDELKRSRELIPQTTLQEGGGALFTEPWKQAYTGFGPSIPPLAGDPKNIPDSIFAHQLLAMSKVDQGTLYEWTNVQKGRGLSTEKERLGVAAISLLLPVIAPHNAINMKGKQMDLDKKVVYKNAEEWRQRSLDTFRIAYLNSKLFHQHLRFVTNQAGKVTGLSRTKKELEQNVTPPSVDMRPIFSELASYYFLRHILDLDLLQPCPQELYPLMDWWKGKALPFILASERTLSPQAKRRKTFGQRRGGGAERPVAAFCAFEWNRRVMLRACRFPLRDVLQERAPSQLWFHPLMMHHPRREHYRLEVFIGEELVGEFRVSSQSRRRRIPMRGKIPSNLTGDEEMILRLEDPVASGMLQGEVVFS